MKVSRYQGRWSKTPAGPLSLDEALAFVRGRGVHVPDDILWLVAEHEGLTLRETGLEREDADGLDNADVRYFGYSLNAKNQDEPIQWEAMVNAEGKGPVFLRAEVLESEAHTLYVLSHEIFGLVELKRLFKRGVMTYLRLARLIDPRFGGLIHRDAVEYADALVGQLRSERGISA